MKHTKIFWFSDISCETFMSAKPLRNRFYEIHMCQQDLLSLSQTCYVFESDLPYFASDIPCIESDLPVFRTSPSHFSNESFSIFQISPSNFFKPDLPIFFGSFIPTFPRHSCSFSNQTFLGSALPTFWVRSSHFGLRSSLFFGSVLPTFPSQTSSFFESELFIYWVSPSQFFESDLSILFRKLLFSYLEFILQFMCLIRRCLTWDVNRKYIFRWRNWFRGNSNKLFYAGFTYTEILEFLAV